LATQHSDSEHSADEDAPDQQPTSPSYWPIPEDRHAPQPADPSDEQIQAWIISQQPWTTFRHRLPTQQRLAYEHRPPPAITRQDPNRSYMMDFSDESIDPVYLRERIADFRSSGHTTWTSYLNTLSHRIRQAYLDQPPNPADFKPTAISALHAPDYDHSSTQAKHYEPKDPAMPHSDDQVPTRLGGYASTSSHTNTNNPPQSSRPPPPVPDTVPPDTERLRTILTNLRTTQTSPSSNHPDNSSRPGGYYTGHDPAHSSDSDNDNHPAPASRTSPPPEDLSGAQIQAWITSQLPWSIYRQRLPIHQRPAYGKRPPPPIVRQRPNQQYLWAHHDDSIDSLRPANRMAAFHTSNSPTWSDYLTTLAGLTWPTRRLPTNKRLPPTRLHPPQ
jgi:hypothetical protein